MRKVLLIMAVTTIAGVTIVSAARGVSQRGRGSRRPSMSASTPKLASAHPSSSLVSSLPADQPLHLYKGIRVNAGSEANIERMSVNQNITRIVEQLDYVPEVRLQYFRHHLDDRWQVLTGWSAEILDATLAFGGTQFTLKVFPRFASGLMTTEYTLETYLMVDGNLHYLGTETPEVPRVYVLN